MGCVNFIKKEVFTTKKSNNKKLIKPTNLYQEAERRLLELYDVRTTLLNSLKNAPNECVRISKEPNRVAFYSRESSSDKNGKYIPKKDLSRIKALVQKDYDTKVLKLLNKEIANLESFLKDHSTIPIQIQQLYSDNPNEVKSLIKPVDISNEDYKNLWLKQKYQPKNVSDLTTTFITDNNEKVRSKSELTIANALAKRGIAYKYECPLMLSNGIVIYPDFTVFNERLRQVIYWEHRGMMDNEEYSRHAVTRIKEYMNSELLLGINLVITEETSESPIGTNEIKKIINKYLV